MWVCVGERERARGSVCVCVCVCVHVPESTAESKPKAERHACRMSSELSRVTETPSWSLQSGRNSNAPLTRADTAGSKEEEGPGVGPGDDGNRGSDGKAGAGGEEQMKTKQGCEKCREQRLRREERTKHLMCVRVRGGGCQ